MAFEEITDDVLEPDFWLCIPTILSVSTSILVAR